MTGLLNLGSDYNFEEDSTGDLVITDSTGAKVARHEQGSGEKIAGVSKSTGGDLSFGDYEQVSADRPAIVLMQGTASTDGSTDAEINISVDESGGTVVDYTIPLARASATLTSGSLITSTATLLLPAGAQYRVENTADPNNINSFSIERVFEL